VRWLVRTGGMVVAPDLSSGAPQDVLFSQLSARAIEAVCLLMLDSFDLETLMSAVLRCRLNGMQKRLLRDAGANG